MDRQFPFRPFHGLPKRNPPLHICAVFGRDSNVHHFLQRQILITFGRPDLPRMPDMFCVTDNLRPITERHQISRQFPLRIHAFDKNRRTILIKHIIARDNIMNRNITTFICHRNRRPISQSLTGTGFCQQNDVTQLRPHHSRTQNMKFFFTANQRPFHTLDRRRKLVQKREIPGKFLSFQRHSLITSFQLRLFL